MPLPPTLSRLLDAEGERDRERAWEAFVAEHSRLIHSVARRAAPEYDDTMDRYAFVLERLEEEDFKRLRSFDPAGRSKFTTWLVVVASRLCVDWHRRRYGRGGGSEQKGDAQERHRLVDLIGVEVGVDGIPQPDGSTPEDHIRRDELHRALDAALAGLEAGDRLLLRLRFQDRRPVPEIARSLGLSSEFVVYRRIKRVLADLRRDLLRRGVDGPGP